jgi:hypothetical protein
MTSSSARRVLTELYAGRGWPAEGEELRGEFDDHVGVAVGCGP